MSQEKTQPAKPSTSTWAGVFIGMGLMAGVDEIIFHQVLAWHHFYDRSTTEVGLLTDGLLHAAELVAIVAGFFMLFRLQQDKALRTKRAWAGLFLGMGGFQLFDGLVNHKILRLHQIRYVENVLPYDIAWNAAGFLLLVVSLILMGQAKKKAKTTAEASRLS